MMFVSGGVFFMGHTKTFRLVLQEESPPVPQEDNLLVAHEDTSLASEGGILRATQE